MASPVGHAHSAATRASTWRFSRSSVAVSVLVAGLLIVGMFCPPIGAAMVVGLDADASLERTDQAENRDPLADYVALYSGRADSFARARKMARNQNFSVSSDSVLHQASSRQTVTTCDACSGIYVESRNGWTQTGAPLTYETAIGGQNNARAVLELGSAAAGQVELDVFVDSEGCCDFLSVEVDGAEVWREAGSDKSESLQVDVEAGSIITLTYSKDGSVHSHSDTAGLTAVRFTPCITCSAVALVDSDGWWASGGPFAFVTRIAGQNSETAELRLAVNEPGALELDVFVDSEGCCDFLSVEVDGAEVWREAGADQSVTLQLDVEAGLIITLTYSKDGSVHSNSDTAGLSGLRFATPTPTPTPSAGGLDPITQLQFEATVTLMQSANWRSRTAIDDFYTAVGSRSLSSRSLEEERKSLFMLGTERVDMRPADCQIAINQFGGFFNFFNNRFRTFKDRVNQLLPQNRRIEMMAEEELNRVFLAESAHEGVIDGSDSGPLERQSGITPMDDAARQRYNQVLTLARSANWRSRTAIEDFEVFIGMRRELVDESSSGEMDLNVEQLEAVLLRTTDNPEHCREAIQVFNRFFNFMNNRFRRFKNIVNDWVESN